MSSRKRKVFEELGLEFRLSQAATDRFDEAVSHAVGINRTDMRCIDVLDFEGPVPAGRLAEVTGLTTGAITAVLDRLEKAGWVRRVRDTEDRRRVLVELDPGLRAKATEYYAGHSALAERMYERYTTEQLELLLEFLREGRVFNEEAAVALEARNRARD